MAAFIKSKWKKMAALLLALALFVFAVACTADNPTPGGDDPETPIETPEDPDPSEPDTPGGGDEDEFEFAYDTSYEPTLFDAESASFTVTELAEGVHLIENRITLNNGNVSVVYATEVDLSLADIVAGTAGNDTWDYDWQKAVPYSQLQAWEEDHADSRVLACVNADFFGGLYTTTSVNAFVKDGIILKAGHNDNGNYDYSDLSSDVPASAPMLFGVKGDTAQIAPIVSYEGDITSAEVKQQLIQAQLSYTGKFSHHYSEHVISVSGTIGTDSLAFLSSGTATAPAGSIILTLSLGDPASLEITGKSEAIFSETLTAGSGTGYLVMHPDYEGNKSALRLADVGDTLQLTVVSPDGLWDGYDTILGCRQALVIDGAVAETVALENTNGAQSAGVPRTAVGIKQDGTVVIFSVEGLRYGNNSQDESESYGMNLPQLAQFIRFYGCLQSANFDGGGSTQLIVQENGEHRVAVRSSDTGSSSLSSSRAVMNTLLVTAPKGV